MRLGVLADVHGTRSRCGPPPGAGLTAEHRTVPFDAGAVARDLRARLHPNAEFLGAIHAGRRSQYPHPAGGQ